MLVTLGVNLGKVKNKNHDEVRFLQGEVRRLEKVIRHLEMQLKSSRKMEHMYEVSQDTEVLSDSEDTFLKKGIQCDHCGKGYYVEFEIMNKCYGTCNICGDRKKLR